MLPRVILPEKDVQIRSWATAMPRRRWRTLPR